MSYIFVFNIFVYFCVSCDRLFFSLYNWNIGCYFFLFLHFFAIIYYYFLFFFFQVDHINRVSSPVPPARPPPEVRTVLTTSNCTLYYTDLNLNSNLSPKPNPNPLSCIQFVTLTLIISLPFSTLPSLSPLHLSPTGASRLSNNQFPPWIPSTRTSLYPTSRPIRQTELGAIET